MRRNRPLSKEVGHLEGINIKFKGYVYHQHLYTVRQGDGSNTTMPLKVFTQRLFHKRMQSSKIFGEFEVQG